MWDLILACTQVGLDICLLPTVFRSTSYVPRFTSSVTAMGLAIAAVALFNLGAPLSGLSALTGSFLWAVIFIKRGHSK